MAISYVGKNVCAIGKKIKKGKLKKKLNPHMIGSTFSILSSSPCIQLGFDLCP